MNQLEPTILNGKRVLTTAQLAEAYGTEPRIINNNFGRNISRYKAEKHYFLLEGTDLKEFKRNHQFDESLNRVNKLYLWTEKGAWLHAKSLNTDQAWDAYEMLVDEYYTIQENVVPLSKDQALVTVLRTTADLVEGHESIIKEQHEIRKLISQVDQKVDEQITLDYGEQRRLQKGVATKVYEVCDDPQLRPKLFRELYREIKDRFGVASYKDVKRKELQAALRYIENWIPRKVS
ncbi:ORF6N domain-containing protein [Niallia circulans]|uniref:ORF6N domain-containing protein n=1 Tax=Niallia circulans TaxID=1397 RepID=UPI001560D177|nr:ORF6N domain-containing protein [Niallia circulans]NRG34798.1 ORF6C domain-containing protein [Niallia circulans]